MQTYLITWQDLGTNRAGIEKWIKTGKIRKGLGINIRTEGIKVNELEPDNKL